MSLIDNLTFKYLDTNRMGVSFNFNKNTYFYKDYSLPVTDFQLLMTIRDVHWERVNHLWNGAMITDHHGMIENKTKRLKATSSNHNNNNNNYNNNNVYIYCESHYIGLSVCYEC